MSKGISIKIGGEWVAVNENSSISIEMNSPIFNEEGTFSLPFELPYEENRHLFGNIGDLDGAGRLQDLNGKEFELYYDDVLLYYGAIETDDEEEITDVIPVNFVSGNSMLKDLVEGMKANKVEVKDDLYLGYLVEQLIMTTPTGVERIIQRLDPEVFMNYEGVNVTDAYPIKKFCNVRICYQPEESDGNKSNEYLTLEAKRPWSGVCFYLMYFFDCLFYQLGFTVSTNQMLLYEDLKRVAFFTTKCEYEKRETIRTLPLLEPMAYVPDLSFRINNPKNNYYLGGVSDIYATGMNFPDEDIDSIISSTRNAFGVRFVVDSTSKKINIYLLKEIFADSQILDLNAEIVNKHVKHYAKRGIVVKYNNSDEDDTSYNYNNFENINSFSDYGSIIKYISSYDMDLYVNSISGKKFRVKVNKDAGNKEEWYPSLFEVAQFNKVKIGDADEENCEEIEIGFTPIIMNDVNAKEERKGSNQQILAAFLDVEMKTPETHPYGDVLKRVKESDAYYTWTKRENYEVENLYSTVRSYGSSSGNNSSRSRDSSRLTTSSSGRSTLSTRTKGVTTYRVSYGGILLWNYATSSPLRSQEFGLTIGIMRGPGNDSEIEIIQSNYDENGNDSWISVAANYAFDEDYITNWNQVYDYNGTEPGVPYLDDMFSLKLRAKTPDLPIDEKYANRGIVDKFLSEYAYFLSNRKAIIMTVHMELSQLINIRWEKKYRIGDRIGYINNISYSISNQGISDVTIELFTI